MAGHWTDTTSAASTHGQGDITLESTAQHSTAHFNTNMVTQWSVGYIIFSRPALTY